MDPRYEVVRGFNEEVFAELCDKRLAPGGLAFLLRRSPEGPTTLAGFDVDVPVEVFQQFLAEALPHVLEDPETLLKRWVEGSSEE
jgi:hypothetical protein